MSILYLNEGPGGILWIQTFTRDAGHRHQACWENSRQEREQPTTNLSGFNLKFCKYFLKIVLSADSPTTYISRNNTEDVLSGWFSSGVSAPRFPPFFISCILQKINNKRSGIFFPLSLYWAFFYSYSYSLIINSDDNSSDRFIKLRRNFGLGD